MKIGIIGSGDVAKSLGSGFLKHGYEVMLGTRSPEKLAEWLSGQPIGTLVISRFERTVWDVSIRIPDYSLGWYKVIATNGPERLIDDDVFNRIRWVIIGGWTFETIDKKDLILYTYLTYKNRVFFDLLKEVGNG